MTTTTDDTKTQLAAVLSALDDQPRHPANREAALKAIGRSAARLGLTTAEVLAAAPGLLDGRLSAAAWRAELRAQADPTVALEQVHRAAVVPAAPEDGGEGGDAEADAGEAPEPATAAVAAPGAGAATAAAPEPTPAPDAATTEPEPTGQRTPRPGTKQALLIELLRRPEGATVEQIAAATGWQHHTVRGAISGALKKKLGLTIAATRTRAVGPNRTGAKGSGTVYRIPGSSPRTA